MPLPRPMRWTCAIADVITQIVDSARSVQYIYLPSSRPVLRPRTLWAIKMKDEEKIYLLLEDGTEIWPVDLIDRNRPVDEEVVLVEPNPGLQYRLLPRYDNIEAARLLPYVQGDIASVLGGLARDLDEPNEGAFINRLHCN